MVIIRHNKLGLIVGVYCAFDLEKVVMSFFQMFEVYVSEEKIYCDTVYGLEYKNNKILLTTSDVDFDFCCVEEALIYLSDVLVEQLRYVGAYFHGAVSLDKSGRAVAIIGKTMIGKTSFNMFLYKHGYRFLSDDKVIVDDALQVISFPTGIKVRRGIIWDDSYFDKFCVYKNDNYKILSLNVDMCLDKKNYDIGKFIFLQRGYETLSVKEISGGELFLALFENSSKLNSVKNQAFTAAALSKSIKAYVLNYSKLDYELLKLINSI